MKALPDEATFDGAPVPGVIDFGVGQPSADLLPVELLHASSGSFFQVAQPLEFNYGEIQGDRRFRSSVARLLSSEYGKAVDAESLFLTGGNSQALDFVCERFTRPGDVVFVEEPSYFLAFQIFADHGLEVIGIPVDNEGMVMERLQAELHRVRPRLVYTIPSFHNPGGQSLAADRRRRLAALSREHDFIIAADEAYQLLWYRDPPPPPLGCLAEHGNVLSLGTFSKILAPGLRLGWIQTNADLMETLLESGALRSGGTFNHFTSHFVRHAIDRGSQADHIRRLREVYRERLDAMSAALEVHFSGRARWLTPTGGYFFWLEFPLGFNAAEALRSAQAHGTGYQPGARFSSRGGLEHCLRLSFAHYPPDDIRLGIERLAEATER